MSLSPGEFLGPYEVKAPIGTGGMGAVYRARDSKLGRDVALKVLAPGIADDADYLSRFQREAQILAALNHPNIAQIYGIEQHAIVMELVEGRSPEGPMPLDEALDVARQIAAALEAAHEKGIVHRDLKPANVKITPEGLVKVLDFGLAKAVEAAAADTSNSPTLTIRSTQAGTILGTAAYMAPEQARGHDADRRADVWAFGAVVYEMLTGRMAFGGESVTDILAAVVKLEPDWSALPRSTPRRVRELLRRCLTKDRRQRLQAIGEARIALEQTDSPAPESGGAARRFHPVTAVALVIAAGAGAAAWRAMTPAARPLIRLAVQPGPEFVFAGDGPSAILSPDGARLVYIGAGPDGTRRLYTRLMDEEQSSALAGTEGATGPFFSPDGQSVGFFAGNKLRKVYARGGGAVTLCDAPLPQGGSWGEDGNIVAALASSGVLSRIPSGGGAPQPLTKLRNELTHRWPQVLPGAEVVLFTAHTAGLAFDDATIEAQSLRTGERKTLVRGGAYGRYSPSGHLLYVRNRVLFAAPMDLRKLELTGPAAPVLEGVESSSYGGAQVDISANGTLLYAKTRGRQQNLFWLDVSGAKRPLRPGAFEYSSTLAFAPDGKRLAMVVTEAGNPDIWVYEPDRDTTTRLSFTPGLDAFPKWSPDGKHILFSSVRHGGAQNLYWMRADGAGEATRLTESGIVQIPGSISPDGKRMAFTQVDPQTGYDIWTATLEGADGDRPKAGIPEPFLRTPFNELNPAISPDGRWLAYVSYETGDAEVFVRRFPGPGGKWRVSTNGGQFVLWANKDRALYYQTRDGIMVCDYTADGENFAAGRPRLWAAERGIRIFDIAPDGKRAAVTEDETTGIKETPQVMFVFGFGNDLQRRAPARGN